MRANTLFKTSFLTLVILLFIQHAQAQDADALFADARRTAFDQKDYPKAIALSKMALAKAPNYKDVRVFLGRLYTWSKEVDSARTAFTTVIEADANYEDAYIGLVNLEFWNDHSQRALEIVNKGLQNIPNSIDLLLLKAKVLNDLKQWKEADQILSQILKANPKQTDARALATRIRDNSAKNRVGVSYDYIHFDKQFTDPWHLASIDYGRQTAIGSIIGRVNYANRFNNSGVQLEVDAYPRISNTFQAYVSFGYAPEANVFSKYRGGFSLYASLPKSFEAEVGFRYLHFQDNTWIYTASVGKYYKNFWFNLRTYLTPSIDEVSQSFSLNTRYYFGGADDYWSLSLSTGLSPDEQKNNLLINSAAYKLKSNGISLGYRKSFKTFNVLSFNAGIDHQEYLKDTKGNQLTLGIAYKRRF